MTTKVIFLFPSLVSPKSSCVIKVPSAISSTLLWQIPQENQNYISINKMCSEKSSGKNKRTF